MKNSGGLYVYRVRKHWAIIGLPIVGRHFGYGGMTNSFAARREQHLKGSDFYKKPAASWSDLDPKVYEIGLPDWMVRSRWGRRLTVALETIMIAVLCPVYNDRQQAPWNLRKISRAKAKVLRAERDLGGFMPNRWVTAIAQYFINVLVLSFAGAVIWKVWM